MRSTPQPPARVDTIQAQRADLRALGGSYGLEQLWVVGDGLVVADLDPDTGDYLAAVEFERDAERLLEAYVAVVPLSAHERQPFGVLEEL